MKTSRLNAAWEEGVSGKVWEGIDSNGQGTTSEQIFSI